MPISARNTLATYIDFTLHPPRCWPQPRIENVHPRVADRPSNRHSPMQPFISSDFMDAAAYNCLGRAIFIDQSCVRCGRLPKLQIGVLQHFAANDQRSRIATDFAVFIEESVKHLQMAWR